MNRPKRHKLSDMTVTLDRRILFADGWKPHITWMVILKRFDETRVYSFNKHPKSYANYREARALADNAHNSRYWDIIIVQEKPNGQTSHV